MTIVNKLLTAALFFTSLSHAMPPAKEIIPAIQLIGATIFGSGNTAWHLGRKLIAAGHHDLNFDKMPSYYKSPRNLKIFGGTYMLFGFLCMISPILFQLAENAGKKYREQKAITNQKTLDKSSQNIDVSIVVV